MNTGATRKDTARAEAISHTIVLDTPEHQAHDAVQGDVPVPNMDWKPPQTLETPPAPAGWHFTWVRSMSGATDDSQNVVKALQEGYQFASTADIPRDYFAPTLESARFGGNKTLIGVRDMVLMKIPLRMKKQRDAHYLSRAMQKEAGVDARLMAENTNRQSRFFSNSKSTSGLHRGPLDDGGDDD